MTTVSELVRKLIVDDPQKYGSDGGTSRLFTSVLIILEKEQQDAVPTLTTVERVRRKFLENNPRYDYRDRDKKQRAQSLRK